METLNIEILNKRIVQLTDKVKLDKTMLGTSLGASGIFGSFMYFNHNDVCNFCFACTITLSAINITKLIRDKINLKKYKTMQNTVLEIGQILLEEENSVVKK